MQWGAVTGIVVVLEHFGYDQVFVEIATQWVVAQLLCFGDA